MAINLLDMLKSTAGDALIKQASGFLGESESKTSSAVGAIFPALLGSIMQKGSTKSGAESLLGMLKDGGHDGSIFDNLGGLFSGGAKTDGLLNTGTSILSGLLGNKLGGVVDLIAGAAGIKNGIAGSLLKMAAPLVMSAIGKQILGKGLGISGLMDLLGGQKKYVADAAPKGLGSLLGFADLGEGAKKVVTSAANTASRAAGSAASTATAAANRTVDAGKSGMSNILKYLLPLLLIAGAFLGYRACQNNTSLVDEVKDAGSAVVEGAKDAGDAVADGAKAAGNAVADGAKAVKDAVMSISLPGGAEIKAAAGSFTDKFVKFLGGKDGDLNTRFSFDGVNFETGSATLTADSKTQIGNLASVMKAYPGVNIRLEGHTDNTGDAAKNKTLSGQRAMAVKNALAQMGIASNRVATAGFGQEKPIADNGTEEGRAENRRVDVYITKR
ncbi:MAG: OmpA family protein [Bacteroidota bacterium]